MNFAWRNAGLNYLQASNIAARALRRVLVAEKRADTVKREHFVVKVAKWNAGKSTETAEIPSVRTRSAADL